MDGSGKTTLVTGVVDAMHRQGLPAERVYGKFQPVLLRAAFAIGAPLLLGGKFGRGDYDRYAQRRKDALAGRRFLAAYVGLVGVDYLGQVYTRIGGRLLRVRSLV